MRSLKRGHVRWRPGDAVPCDPQAEPPIGKAINGGFDLLEAKCNRCDRMSLADRLWRPRQGAQLLFRSLNTRSTPQIRVAQPHPSPQHQPYIKSEQQMAEQWTADPQMRCHCPA